MTRWQVDVGLQVTCNLLLEHTTPQHVSTELHTAAGLISADITVAYVWETHTHSVTLCRASASALLYSTPQFPKDHCISEGFQVSPFMEQD
jgi:hypothetical protein